MEKRRRARINHSLNELKSLILDALNKDPSRHSKLEKADILEMTVRYLKNMERQQMAVEIARDPQVMNKYRAGFSECATEVSRYVSRIDGVDDGLKRRLVNHLSGCVTSLNINQVPSNGQTSVPVATPVQFAAGIAFPGMTISASPLPIHVQIPSGLFSSSSSNTSAVNLSLHSGSDINNNTNSNRINSSRTESMMDTKLTPPSSASSHQSFMFPSSVNTMSPITPSTPGTSNLYFWPRSQPLGSVSPGSSSSFGGSLSPTGSDSVFPDSRSEARSPITPSSTGDVWRPW